MMCRPRIIPTLAVIIVMAAAIAAARPELAGISVKAGSRGLALVLDVKGSGGESFSCRIVPGPAVSTVHIVGSGVEYAIDQKEFGAFAPAAPVSSARASISGGTVSVDFTVKGTLDPSALRVKKLAGRVAFLLGTNAYPEYGWNVSGGSPSVKKDLAMVGPAPVVAETPARIEGFQLLRRGNAEELCVAADRDVKVLSRRSGTTVVLDFENTISVLPKSSYVVPSGAFCRGVTVNGGTRGGKPFLTVRIALSPNSTHVPIVRILPGKATLYSFVDDSSRISLWSARDGLVSSYGFVSSATPRTGPRLALSRDNVNMRETPESGAVIRSLDQGTSVVVLAEKGDWKHIALDDGASGWVKSSMLGAVSASASIVETTADAPRIVPAAAPVQLSKTPASVKEKPVASFSPSAAKTSAQVPAGKEVDVLEAAVLSGDSIVARRTTAVVMYADRGRDPFLPIDQCEFLQSDLPNVEKMTLVGILFDAADRVALFEDTKGAGSEPFAMREGAAVKDGRLLKIKKNSVVFLLNEAGFSRTFELELQNGEEKK